MGKLIDSSAVIAFERAGRPVKALLDAASDEQVALASISASELLVGVHRADTTARRDLRAAFLESVLRRIPIFPFTLPVARVHADLLARLLATGTKMGGNDLIIGATALTHGYGVLTENVRDFERIPGLVVRRPDW